MGRESGSWAEYGGHSLLQGRAHCSTIKKTNTAQHISAQIERCTTVYVPSSELVGTRKRVASGHPPPPSSAGEGVQGSPNSEDWRKA
jgi:hypothetical protein